MSKEDFSRLINVFLEHLPQIEGQYPYMYLDSRGYLTIGLGHLISKLEGTYINNIIEKYKYKLGKDINIDKIGDIDEESLELIHLDQGVQQTLNELYNIPFKTSHGFRTKPNQKGYFKIEIPIDSIKPLTMQSESTKKIIKQTFDELLEKSLKCKILKLRNPDFTGYFAERYYTPVEGVDGHNCLIIDEGEIKKLANRDIAEKIRSINIFYPDFSQYPLSAQLALLDLSYNMGANKLKTGWPNFNTLVIQKKWKEIVDQKEYTRKGEEYAGRNEQVRQWFLEAANSK